MAKKSRSFDGGNIKRKKTRKKVKTPLWLRIIKYFFIVVGCAILILATIERIIHYISHIKQLK